MTRDFSPLIKRVITGVFNEPWKKILGQVSYVLQVLGGLVLLLFIRYESQGNLAQFRTALNQLTSWIGVNVSTYTYYGYYKYISM